MSVVDFVNYFNNVFEKNIEAEHEYDKLFRIEMTIKTNNEEETNFCFYGYYPFEITSIIDVCHHIEMFKKKKENLNFSVVYNITTNAEIYLCNNVKSDKCQMCGIYNAIKSGKYKSCTFCSWSTSKQIQNANITWGAGVAKDAFKKDFGKLQFIVKKKIASKAIEDGFDELASLAKKILFTKTFQ